MTRTVVTASEEETSAVARDLAAGLDRGAVVVLEGELGAGKTAFVRGLAEGLGVDPEEVSSPTFTLIQEYAGRLRLFHVDLYRLGEPEVEDLGLEELASLGVMAVEWGERWRRPAGSPIHVRIEDAGGTQRRITLTRAAGGA